jgi:hypothetical protein
MLKGLPNDIKSECWYYVKYLADQGFTFRQVLPYCIEANKQLFRGEGGSNCRRHTTRYIQNIRHTPSTYTQELRSVTATAAPVIADIHNYLLEHYPERFVMSSSDSFFGSSSSLPSSLSDGVARARAGTTLPAPKRSLASKHSSDAAALSAHFANLTVAPCNKGVSPCSNSKKNRRVKALV